LHAFCGECRQLRLERSTSELQVGVVAKRAAPEDDTARLARRVDVTRRQLRLVRGKGSHADGDSVDTRAQLVHTPTRPLAADPALARPEHAAIERDRELEDDERPPFRRPRPPRLVLRAAAKSELSFVDRHGNAGCAQALQPTAVLGMRIETARRDGRNPRVDQRIRTRGRSPVVGARLHRHVRRRAAGARPRLLQRDRLRVRTAGLLVPRLADDPTVVHEHAAHDRIRMGRAAAALRQLERSLEAHCSAWSSRPYALGRSPVPKIELPATNRRAPATYASPIVSTPIPPSTWIGTSSGRISRASRMRGSASGMNGWPEYPGSMLMQRPRSNPPTTAARAACAASVAGLNAIPACSPSARAA